ILVEPVKDILSMPECRDMASPMTPPSPVTTLTTPGGNKSAISWARRIEDVGVNSEGLITTVQPAASAGAILMANINSGAFQAVIKPQTPTGSLKICECQLSGSGLQTV